VDMAAPNSIVVIGGGAIGVCIALFLRKRGREVLLLEAESIACAASGRAGG